MKVKPADRTSNVQEYYFSQKLAHIDQMRRDGADVINLGIGSPDQPPSDNTISALIAEAKKSTSHGYQSYRGSPALRIAFSQWYKKYFKVELDPDDEILPLMGSKEGIMHISMAFVNPGDEVLVPDPGYPTYSSVTHLVSGIVRKYDLDEKKGWPPDLEALEQSDLSRVKLMWVNYPHMPTGTKGSMTLFEKLVAFSQKHGILLCNDNPYSFILNKEYISLLAVDGAKETALELNSLSKSQNMAGWRIGMIAGHNQYIKNVLKVKSNMDSGMFLPLQIAAVEALNNPDSWYDTVNTVYIRRRKIVEEIMEILNCKYGKSQVGLFLWGRIPEDIINCELFIEDILNKAHLFITPGFIFGKNGERYIRISLCASEKRLMEAKDRLLKYKE
ncbi:MAG TPA: aminotransferase class I/II-fold pyridoxal phosphate-dependent enzyme [Bacteroidales bacterium]|nr:aminotransferase class I/II-fold pyridoxal phosphate-dependent enzyme [Bacteroidales bacterium]